MTVLERLKLIEAELLNTTRLIDLHEDSKESFSREKSVVLSAIKNREILGIYYSDVTSSGTVLAGFRLIEPYAYGVGYAGSERHKDTEYVRVYVIADTKFYKNGKKFSMRRKSVSKSNKKGGWRLMRMDRIQDAYSTKKKFNTRRPEYNPNDRQMVSVLVSATPGIGR